MSKQEEIALHCPYCDTKFNIMGRDVFVILGRLGLCFANCKKCGQTIGIDKELGYDKLEEADNETR